MIGASALFRVGFARFRAEPLIVIRRPRQTLTSNTFRHSAGSISVNGVEASVLKMPALFTRTSTPP
jgi:hypothetical protein